MTETTLSFREAVGDFWEMPGDARCITTNGTLKKDARGVMGRGVAQQAKLRYLGLERRLGQYLLHHGNHVGVLIDAGEEARMPLLVFPVKYEWYDQHASLELIRQSARELVELTEARGWGTVLLPRPGCGNGALNWIYVQRILAPILDERFVIVVREREADEAYWQQRRRGGGSASDAS